MTDDILQARRSNMVKKHIEGRESLDIGDKFTFEPNAADCPAFESLYKKPESPKCQDPIDLSIEASSPFVPS
jgi:hypothetical protein